MKKLLLTFLVSLGLVLSLASPVVVHASPASDACKVLQEAHPGSTCDEDASKSRFNNVLKQVIDIFSIVVGATSLIMIIIGGFRYIISGGDSNGVQGAKNTILYALVGLVVVLFSQIIARFVLATATAPPTP